MRSLARGWRSARAYPAPAPAPAAVTPNGHRARLTSGVAAAPAHETPFVWPWQNVKWNAAFVGFCAYSVAVITYIAPIGQISMLIALIGLAMSRDRLRFPAPFLFFAAYYLYAWATFQASPWPMVAKEELMRMLRVALIFFVAVNVLTERTRLRFYLFLYLGCFALYPVRGAIFNQFIYHAAELGRIAWNGMFANPNDLAALLLFPLGLCAGVLFTERHKFVRYAAMGGIALIALIIFMTQSRGSILALGFFAAWAFLRQKKKARLIPVILGVGLVVVLFAPDSVWTRLANLKEATTSGQLMEAEDQGSAEQRFEIWKVAARITAANPVTGVGLGVYPYEHWKYARSSLEGFKKTARGLRDAHSSYLTAMAETGIPGFIFWFGCFLSAFLAANKARRLIKASDPGTERLIFFAQLGMMAFGLAAIFGSWNGTPYTYINVTILYGLAVVAMEQYRQRRAAMLQGARSA